MNFEIMDDMLRSPGSLPYGINYNLERNSSILLFTYDTRPTRLMMSGYVEARLFLMKNSMVQYCVSGAHL